MAEKSHIWQYPIRTIGVAIISFFASMSKLQAAVHFYCLSSDGKVLVQFNCSSSKASRFTTNVQRKNQRTNYLPMWTYKLPVDIQTAFFCLLIVQYCVVSDHPRNLHGVQALPHWCILAVVTGRATWCGRLWKHRTSLRLPTAVRRIMCYWLILLPDKVQNMKNSDWQWYGMIDSGVTKWVCYIMMSKHLNLGPIAPMVACLRATTCVD